MTTREDDLYRKVIDIAQEQAQSSSAMTELHRQNVAKIDTLSSLLSAQTTSLVGISTALAHLNEAHERAEQAHQHMIAEAVEDLKAHQASQFQQIKFWREPKFWLAIGLIALSGSSDTIGRLIGVFK